MTFRAYPTRKMPPSLSISAAMANSCANCTVPESPVTFPEAGSMVVERVAYKDGRVQINGSQYFAGVPTQAWEFYIGGYQPAQKWLKDRKGRTLSFEDIAHYRNIISVLIETARIMEKIDA